MKTMARNPATCTSDDHQALARTLDLERWRTELESRWQRKLDELIVLSRACADVASDIDDFAGLGAPPYRRLQRRTERTYDDLAAIEAAIARVDGHTYGICARCGSLMSDDWLADQPDVRHCRSCA
jgi:RNA polymerase-binding transcription factor DksA